jgi:hypothetical protein
MDLRILLAAFGAVGAELAALFAAPLGGGRKGQREQNRKDERSA